MPVVRGPRHEAARRKRLKRQINQQIPGRNLSLEKVEQQKTSVDSFTEFYKTLASKPKPDNRTDLRQKAEKLCPFRSSGPRGVGSFPILDMVVAVLSHPMTYTRRRH